MLIRLLGAIAIFVSVNAYCQEEHQESAPAKPRTEQELLEDAHRTQVNRNSYYNTVYAAEWKKAIEDAPQYGFTFARIPWNARPDITPYYLDKSYWQVDFPEADKCLLNAMKRVVPLVRTNPTPLVLPADDKRWGQLPFAFITEAGWVNFTDAETKNLGDWLRRGGFLMVDDFHGPLEMLDGNKAPKDGADEKAWKEWYGRPNEWRQWMQQLKKMIPELIETKETWSEATMSRYRGDFVILRLDINHPIFNVHFGHREIPHVKGTRPGNNEWEEGSSQHYIMGLFNTKGILIALMNYNMDIGDGWEFCAEMDKTPFGRTQVPAGLKLGINYVLYSLTH